MKTYKVFCFLIICFSLLVYAGPLHADVVVTTVPVPSLIGKDNTAVLGSKIYTADADNNRLLVIDTSNNTISTSSISLGFSPLKIITDGSKIYVSSSPGRVVIVDASTHAITVVAVGQNLQPEHLAVVGGKIFVSNSSTSTISMIDMQNNNATSSMRIVNNLSVQAIQTVGSKLYFIGLGGQNLVGVIDTANGNSTSTIAMGQTLSYSAVVGSFVYVGGTGGKVVTINTANNSTSSISTPGFINLNGMKVYGTKIYLSLYGNRLGILETLNNTFSSITLSGLTEGVLLANGKLYAADSENNLVSIIDPNTNIVSQTIATGAFPIELFSIGTRVYVVNFDEYFMSVIESDTSAPVISNVSLAFGQNNTATLSWTTDENASSSVAYGTSTVYTAVATSTGHTVHSATLSGLIPQISQHHYRVFAKDTAGNISTTTNTIFVYTPPQIQAIGPVGGPAVPEESFQVIPIQQNQPPQVIQGNVVFIQKEIGAGKVNKEVLIIQKVLNSDPDTQVAKHGIGSPGKENIVFGKKTKEAVGKFQIKYGIVKNKNDPGFGRVGPKTKAKMNEIWNKTTYEK